MDEAGSSSASEGSESEKRERSRSLSFGCCGWPEPWPWLWLWLVSSDMVEERLQLQEQRRKEGQEQRRPGHGQQAAERRGQRGARNETCLRVVISRLARQDPLELVFPSLFSAAELAAVELDVGREEGRGFRAGDSAQGVRDRPACWRDSCHAFRGRRDGQAGPNRSTGQLPGRRRRRAPEGGPGASPRFQGRGWPDLVDTSASPARTLDSSHLGGAGLSNAAGRRSLACYGRGWI